MMDIKVTELPIEIENLKSNRFIITSNHVNDITHVFHKYPAKFIPHIPKWGIKFINNDNLLIIDPFCGSGTTNLEAFILGYPSIGFDIDPLALLIAKVKTTPMSSDLLDKSEKKILTAIVKYSSDSDFEYPNILNIDHWFTEDTKKKIAYLKEFILKEFEGNLKDFLIITLSSIIREVSNADNQSQKTYVSHTFCKKPPEVFSFFRRRLSLYKEKILELGKVIIGENTTKPKFIKFDTTKKISNYINKFDKKRHRLVITSPPYIKAIDYIYNQMLEYFWFGDLLGIEGKEKINEYRRNYIGTKQVFTEEYKNYLLTPFEIKDLDKTINDISKINKKHAFITYRYFESMQNNLISISDILRKGEYYLLVIGNTSVSNIQVLTDIFLGEIAERVGFKLIGDFSYKIRNRYMRFDRKGRGGIVEDDNILILERL